MSQTSLHLRDHLLPPGVPQRQWVLTLPFELRGLRAHDAKTLGAVSRIFVDSALPLLAARRPRGQPSALGVERGEADAPDATFP